MTTSGTSSGTGGTLTLLQGVALYVSAVLGTGVIALPALAAGVAGPASLLAWLGLVLLSVPLAGTFAALAARYPDAGGVSHYVRLAFGSRAAAVVGWCFYLAIPTGAPAAALFAGAYVAAAVGGGRLTSFLTAATLMGVVLVMNLFGVRLTGRVQLALSGVLATLLLLTILMAVPDADMSNLRPFAPRGWLAIGPAAALLVWSFAGWEVITHLAAEFKDPRRDLPRATAIAVLVVSVLYLGIAFIVVAVLGSAAATTQAPLGALLSRTFGGDALPLAAAAALMLTLGTMSAYFAGAAKLGSALGRDAAFPTWFSRGSRAGEVPRRSLVVVAGLAFVALLLVAALGYGAGTLVLLTTAQFVTVYVMGLAAATKLSSRGSLLRAAATISLVAVLVLLAATRAYVLWPISVAAVAVLFLHLNRGRQQSAGERPSAGIAVDVCGEPRPARAAQDRI